MFKTKDKIIEIYYKERVTVTTLNQIRINKFQKIVIN